MGLAIKALYMRKILTVGQKSNHSYLPATQCDGKLNRRNFWSVYDLWKRQIYEQLGCRSLFLVRKVALETQSLRLLNENTHHASTNRDRKWSTEPRCTAGWTQPVDTEENKVWKAWGNSLIRLKYLTSSRNTFSFYHQ